MLSKIKHFVKNHQADIILVIGVILISLLSFAMGYIISRTYDKPPLEFETDADLIDYVSRTSGAIGYSCTQPDITMVKILSIK